MPASSLSSRYRGKNLPSASSRLKLYVACVRSFVPKLKKDASAATSSPAVRAALTTSIIVPNATRTRAFPPGPDPLRAATESNMRLTYASSDALPTCGTITCGRASMPRRFRAAAASNTASICISYISG